MTERLMGIETEYAFVARSKRGRVLDLDSMLRRMERLAESSLRHLPGEGCRGIFLQNGSRFYRDYGGGDAHLEFATPECANPWDVVRHVLAGERILQDLVTVLRSKDRRIGEAFYFKTNVDYSGSNSTWGCHESYLTSREIAALPRHLIPHLVSRLIYTGAGGFNSSSKFIEFTLSPRVKHLTQTIASSSEYARPIFHTRDEPLSGIGTRRLHVICGESLCSETAMWLKAGATALVVAMTDAGLNPGAAVELQNPLDSMRRFAADPECKAVVKSTQGKDLTAIAIQRHYLSLAEAHVGAPFMPWWAGDVCSQWRTVLDRLGGAPDSVATTLDWAIKFSWFRDWTRRRGFDWSALARQSNRAGYEALRQELCEIDTRFGQLTENGILASMDRAGILDHHLSGVDHIEQAMIHPPGSARARLRGEWIRRLSGRNGRYTCDWNVIWDKKEQRFLDLSDPFATDAEWESGDGFCGL